MIEIFGMHPIVFLSFCGMVGIIFGWWVVIITWIVNLKKDELDVIKDLNETGMRSCYQNPSGVKK